MRPGKYRPLAAPVLAVLSSMVAGKIVYNLPWSELAPAVHQPVVFAAALVLNFSLVFGPFLIYPVARRRGASIPVAAGAGLVAPVVWDAWEIIRATEFFSPAVALYYGFNPMFLGALCFAAFQMGLWEAVFRFRNQEPRARLLGPALIAGGGLAAVHLLLFWGMGAHFFYLYGKGYQALFQ
ncbi:MAG: hypothetical protein V1816_19050 [Pseudomonadota bacterium]